MSALSLVFSFEWFDKEYNVDLSLVSAADWRAVKHRTGLKMGAFIHEMQNFDDVDGDVFPALLWLGKRQKGEPDPYWDDDLPVFEFIAALGEGSQKAADVAADEVEAPKAGDDSKSNVEN